MTAPHRHQIEIVVGTEAEADFFLDVEEQTTWENLPADRRHIPREVLRERLVETHHKLLAQEGNVVFIARDKVSEQRMGLLWLGPRFNTLTGEEEAWIYNVTVMPQHRGCGVGKLLMKHAEDYARQQGFEVIGLAVASHNEIARAVYEKLDYQESNILMRKSLD